MRRSLRDALRDAALAAALALVAGADAAEALARQARGNLAVTVRVIDRCRATFAGQAVSQQCTAFAPSVVHAEPAWTAPALGRAPTQGSRAATAGQAFVTVIY